jgi:imidazolonepropionase-like amidohydrolase
MTLINTPNIMANIKIYIHEVILYFICFLFTGIIANGQQDTSRTVILLNGIAHIGNGEIIENSAIAINGNQILFVADARTIRIDSSKAEIIHIAGRHVYPGLIAPNTDLGLVEIDRVRATKDFREYGKYNPNVRAKIAFNTDSKILPTLISNGILLAQVVPRDGIISGTSSLMRLKAWNWEDAVANSDYGIHLRWNAINGPQRKKQKEKPQTKNQDTLLVFFDRARQYAFDQTPNVKDLKLESMKGLFDSTQTLFIHVDKAKDILQAIDFAEHYKVNYVLVGVSDAALVLDILKSHHVKVILAPVHRLPSRIDEAIDLPYSLPKLLQDAGILYCLSHRDSWEQRNLSFEAGTAVAYGLTKEQALSTITRNTAIILGVGNQYGTLEGGKNANLIVAEGDMLDMIDSRVIYAFIDGKMVNVKNEQEVLFEKYKEKYGLK